MAHPPEKSQRRIYLDNAATSFPKPPAVIEAMTRYAHEIGANAGRGLYEEAIRSAEIVSTCRRSLAKLLNAPCPDSIVFTHNCTDALNLAINGVIDPARSNHLICTAMDHNSVLRPMHELVERKLATLTVVRADRATGQVEPHDIRRALRPDTRLIAVPHASNVTGVILPVAGIAAIARRHGALFLLDAAQTAGHVAIDVQEMDADLLAVPGHKGLLGPLGTGALYIRPGIERQLRSTRSGGTGSQSESLLQPLMMPDRFEAGSMNVIGLAGLSAGIDWVLSRTIDAIRRHDIALGEAFLAGVQGIARVRVFGPTALRERVGVFSLEVEGLEPAELAMVLESQFGILVRAGLHCAPLAHDAIGTSARGGTVRVSFGAMNTLDDVLIVVSALSTISAGSCA